MITVDFTVDGKPVGKERPRVTSHVTYTPAKTRAYENAVREAFIKTAIMKTPEGYCHEPSRVRFAEIYITAYFDIPQTWSLKRKNSAYGDICTKKPDADNIGKVICDALNGTAYKDDACVTELDVAKRYCGKGEQSRVEVTVAMYVDDDGCGTTRPDHVREIGQ